MNEKFVASGRITLDQGFEELVLQLNKNKPTAEFAKTYLNAAKAFLGKVESFRKLELEYV